MKTSENDQWSENIDFLIRFVVSNFKVSVGMGFMGFMGFMGPMGPMGPIGPMGPMGPMGPTGPMADETYVAHGFMGVNCRVGSRFRKVS